MMDVEKKLKRVRYGVLVGHVETVRMQFFDKAKAARLTDASSSRLLNCSASALTRLKAGQKPDVITYLLMEDCLALFARATATGILPAPSLDKNAQEAVLEKLL